MIIHRRRAHVAAHLPWANLVIADAQRDLLGQAVGLSVCDRDRAAKATEDLAGDGKPQARAGCGLAAGRVGAEKRLEHLIQNLGRDARPVVGDRDNRVVCFARKGDARAAAMGCGVQNQVAQGPLQRKRPGMHLQRGKIGHHHRLAHLDQYCSPSCLPTGKSFVTQDCQIAPSNIQLQISPRRKPFDTGRT
jgi:hypothetical protein